MNRRRALITALAAAFAGSAMHTHGADSKGKRSLGILMGYSGDDPEGQARLKAFIESLASLGWVEDRNLKTTVRWASGDPARAATLAQELATLKPDLILTNTTPASVAVQRATHDIPIVFTVVSDPIGSGLVKSLSHPGGNATGLVNLEASMMGKLLELLKEIAPNLTQVAAIFNPDTAPYFAFYVDPLRASAPKFGLTFSVHPVRDDAGIRRAVEEVSATRGSGLVVMTDSFLTVHRRAVIDECARRKLPAVYATKVMAQDGGLLSYGPETMDLFRRAAPLVDRILRGRHPSELPVEQPTKFDLTINVKTASALGITFPQSILLRADEIVQ